ncbi:PH domain-containing protein [Gordonia paraffinivorans]|uniref:PH domain-containing protein n=1 Tax=Gordonia paraffinivorans TaxID=175628 RepID=A0ABD7V0X3_9ACTN|nr:PH domain-containing protein [Gordonia paraffinivorans]MCD2147449.1 PH domain-containing protein [Gordonia paraffinivorans]VFA88023.1 Uncharacterised protein [Gordonia paraffinivorans]
MLLLLGALLTGVGLTLLAYRPTIDTSGAFDESWTLKTPRTLTWSGTLCGTGMALASAWLAFGDKAAVVGDVPLSRSPSTPWIIVGTLGVIFFGVTALGGIAVMLVNPHHALLALSIDDEHLTVQYGLRRPKTVHWDDVVDLEISGPERSELTSELTVHYRIGRSLSQLHLSKAATGLSPEELEPILRPRWQPDTRTEKNSM